MAPDLDPPVDARIARTRRDVVEVAAGLLLAGGWDAVTHAEVARRAGYSRATLYAHWPTRLALISASIEAICGEATHPPATGNLRDDLRTSLLDFANDLVEGHLDRLLAGLVERAGQGEEVRLLRLKLYETGTRSMRAILADHLEPADVEPALALLTGAVLVRVSYEGTPATKGFIDDLIDRVVGSSRPTGGATGR